MAAICLLSSCASLFMRSSFDAENLMLFNSWGLLIFWWTFFSFSQDFVL
jgi:hypothetical protein